MRQALSFFNPLMQISERAVVIYHALIALLKRRRVVDRRDSNARLGGDLRMTLSPTSDATIWMLLSHSPELLAKERNSWTSIRSSLR
jgi:hypothetical protein